MQFLHTIQANAQELRRNNKSVIIMWMGGGPATIDIWDLKPGRPTGGEFEAIDTTADGVQICQHMPKVAQQMRHLAIIRSLTTTEGDHNRGTMLMHTSYTPNPATVFPSLGSVMAQQAPSLRGYQEVSLPSYVTVGGGRGADGPGFLGMNYAPFNVQNPGAPPDNLQARGLPNNANDAWNAFVAGNACSTTWKTTSWRTACCTCSRPMNGPSSPTPPRPTAKSTTRASAWLPKDGKVFELKGESQSVLSSYGKTPFGRSALLARQLVEAGVSAVEVNLGGWDTHGQNFQALRTVRLPPARPGHVGAGQGPGGTRHVAKHGGPVDGRIRPHAADQSERRPRPLGALLVGGGRRRRHQGRPGLWRHRCRRHGVARNPVRVGDVFATVYRGLGIDPTTQIRDPIGRPFSIAGDHGRPISALF